jgi:hypothetical protein
VRNGERSVAVLICGRKKPKISDVYANNVKNNFLLLLSHFLHALKMKSKSFKIRHHRIEISSKFATHFKFKVKIRHHCSTPGTIHRFAYHAML